MHWRSKLIHPRAHAPPNFRSLAVPTYRGSTVVFGRQADDPMIGAGIAHLIRKNTALIWTESPGSVTMEVQDVPAIAAAAHAHKVPVALDNTYSAGVLFDAFAHGVDVSMQALTKYVGGHSDLLLGTVSVADAGLYEIVGSVHHQLGMAVSPDDCSLALRGLQTLGLRLERLEKTALDVARWLGRHANIEAVLHPALESCAGHDHWRRDFAGSSSIFSVVFKERFSPAQVSAFADRLVRLNVGLEESCDLILDLTQALDSMDA